MATGIKSYAAWRCLQIKAQCDERYERWVKAGRPRPNCREGKWVGDKPITTPRDEYGMKGLRGS